MDEAQKGKIIRGTQGLGTVTPQMIEERARQIARSRMISTGLVRGRN